MADFVSGIKPITPSYPVRPAQPAQKDREPGGRRKKQDDPEPKSTEDSAPDHDGDDLPTIDERV